MPELPEVEIVRRGLARSLPGRSIVAIAAPTFPDVFQPGGVKAVRDRLVGRRIVQVQRRGKHLLLPLDDDQTLHIHLRMTGQLTVTDGGMEAPTFERFFIQLDNGRYLRFADQRKFGRATLLTQDQVTALDTQLGPEPLSPEFTVERFGHMIAGRNRGIKGILLDQALIAGIGNIYADEALFTARIHPLRPASSLNQVEVHALHQAIRKSLEQALANRGTTFSDYRDSQGEAGANQFELQVYGKGRRLVPCPRCGTELTVVRAGGRSSHVCPNCQGF